MWHCARSGSISRHLRPDLLTLHQYYYPGWTAWRAEQAAPLPLQPSRDGLLQIELPTGDYPLTVTLAPLPEELAGRRISLLALLGWLWLTWRHYRPSTSARFAISPRCEPRRPACSASRYTRAKIHLVKKASPATSNIHCHA